MFELAQYTFEEGFVEGLTPGLLAAASDHADQLSWHDIHHYQAHHSLRALNAFPSARIHGKCGLEVISAWHGDPESLYILRCNASAGLWRVYRYTYEAQPFPIKDAVLLIKYHYGLYTLDLY